MNRPGCKFPMLLLLAGIAGGIFVAGCSSRDARQEAVATVNGDPIGIGELRESLGVPAGMFAVPDIPVERKKEALDELVVARLLAQEGRSLGLDNTPEFREILQRSDQRIRIKALLRKEIEAKLKVTGKELKEEIAKLKEANKGISGADAAMRAVKSVSGSRIGKIQADLLAAAMKETAGAGEPKAVPRTGRGEDEPDAASSADRDLAMRALAAYAKKQGVDGSEGYKSIRQELERSVLRGMVADNVAVRNVVVTDGEIDAEYARNVEVLRKRGIRITAGLAAQIKEGGRVNLLRERRKAAVDAYIDVLRKKAKITINEDVLPKV